MITPLKLSPAWMGYGETLSPSRHYVCRIFATSTDVSEALRRDFLVKLAAYSGCEIPLMYNTVPVPVTSRGINLVANPSSSYIELPENALSTWAFVIQPVDNYVTPTVINVTANSLDPRVVAVLIERAQSTIWTEDMLEKNESEELRRSITTTALRPYPYDLALIPDRGYWATLFFQGAMPGRRDVARKLDELGMKYIDPGSDFEAAMTGEGRMSILFTTSGYPMTPRDIAHELGAQSIYIDRRDTVSAEEASSIGLLGWGETMQQRMTLVGKAFGETVTDVAEVAVIDMPEAGLDVIGIVKWSAIAVVVLVAGGVAMRALDFTRSRGRSERW